MQDTRDYTRACACIVCSLSYAYQSTRWMHASLHVTARLEQSLLMCVCVSACMCVCVCVCPGLHEALSERSVDSLHIVGLAADVCVTQTCLDARRLGYAVTLLVNATRPVSAEHMGQTLNRLRDAGVRVVEGAGGESEDERQEAAVQ